MDFIEKIDKVMQERKITGVDIENNTGVKRQTLSSWRSGTTPTIDKAIKVIKYLGLSADDIFDINSDKSLMPAEKSQYIRIGREQLKHVNKVIDIIETETSKDEIMQYLNGLRIYINREIEKYNDWDKHTVE